MTDKFYDIVFRPFCWIKKVIDMFKSGYQHATGHNFIEQPESGKMVNLHLLRCEVCGKYEVGWE